MSQWLVLLHVAVAFLFVAGLIGRNVTLARARSSDQLGLVDGLVQLAGRFERLLVVPGSFAVVLFGLLAAWGKGRPLAGSGNRWLLVSLILYAALMSVVFGPRRRVFEHALADAKEQGELTPALAGAFRDPVVAAARYLELAILAVILTLMVTKPF